MSDIVDAVNISQPKEYIIDEYLNCLYESDKAFEELIAYFRSQQEPVVILMFGDHQPNLSHFSPATVQSSDVTQALAQHVTPFWIWANYPIVTRNAGAVSVNYLASLLLESAGLPLTLYDQWLLETAKEYPIVTLSGYADAQGSYTTWHSESDIPSVLVKLDLLWISPCRINWHGLKTIQKSGKNLLTPRRGHAIINSVSRSCPLLTARTSCAGHGT